MPWVKIYFWGIAQLGERLNGIQEVMGSNPTISILEVSGFIYFLVAERFKPTKDVFGWFYFCLVLFCLKFQNASHSFLFISPVLR